MKIDRASAEQAEALTKIAIAAKSYWGYPKRWIEIWLPILEVSEEYISKYEVWMAVDDEKPIGFYSLEGNELGGLWVSPEFIGHGVGRGLFQHAVDRCGELGFDKLIIESDPNAVGFYEKMGAHRVDESHSEVDGNPRVLPILEIQI